MEFSLEALGLVILERRAALVPGMTQTDLGTEAGYGAGAGVSVSRIENGLTRPGQDRFAGIARSLGLTPSQLEAEAWQRTVALAKERGETLSDKQTVGGDERVKDRVKRVQQEIDRRTSVITELGNAFNEAHDRARDNFFMPFVQIAGGVTGAPQPDRAGLQDDGVADPAAQAEYRIRFTTYGVAHVLAGGMGAGAAGAAVGGAAAYGTFMAAAAFGTASTGAAIAGLSGVAATNAALALLGGGTLAAGGAGVAGGTALLAGIVAAPALVLALGGLVWMVKRNRRQQQELTEKLNQADAEITATRRGYDALTDILPRATHTLSYIALHGGHALKRWKSQLGPRPLDWDAMNADQKQRYQDFVDISASQLAVVGINVQDLMVSRGADREHLVELADEVLNQTQSTVELLV